MKGDRKGNPFRRPIGRLLVKYSRSPAALITGSISSYSVLIGASRRSGGVQFSFSHVPVKCESQISPLLQLKYMVRPSAVKEGSASRRAVLMTRPMVTGRITEPRLCV